MRYLTSAFVLAALMMTGCQAKTVPMGGSSATADQAVIATDGATPSTDSVAASEPGSLALSPANTRIEFIGTHSGEKPDPRKGSFGQFTGKLKVDPASQTLQSITLDIDTASLQTEIDKLTDHLKSPDFFDVRNHPKAAFQSTKIEPVADEAGKFQITGNLTLLEVTKEITAPATVQIGPDGPTLTSEFMLDRTEFGMDYGAGKVENNVALTITIGSKSAAEQP